MLLLLLLLLIFSLPLLVVVALCAQPLEYASDPRSVLAGTKPHLTWGLLWHVMQVRIS